MSVVATDRRTERLLSAPILPALLRLSAPGVLLVVLGVVLYATLLTDIQFIVWLAIPGEGPVGAFLAAFSSDPRVHEAVEQAAAGRAEIDTLVVAPELLISAFGQQLVAEQRARGAPRHANRTSSTLVPGSGLEHPRRLAVHAQAVLLFPVAPDSVLALVARPRLEPGTKLPPCQHEGIPSEHFLSVYESVRVWRATTL